MTSEQIKDILDAHSAWMRGEGGSRADLWGADLSRSDLSDANFYRANLRYADLSGANLSGVNLSGANLRDADLSGANLSGANLSGAYLSDANLSGAVGIERASVSWHGHGNDGRELLCVRIDGALRYFCGCFSGTGDDLQAFIDTDDEADQKTTQSRRKALWVVSDLITESPWEVEP